MIPRRISALRDAGWLALHAVTIWRSHRKPVPGLPCDGELTEREKAAWRQIRDDYGPAGQEQQETW